MSPEAPHNLADPAQSAMAQVRPCLRGDLVVNSATDGGGWIVLPTGVSGEGRSFRFGGDEFQLVQAIDGRRSVVEIHSILRQRPGLESLEMAQVSRLVNWLGEMDLLAPLVQFTPQGQEEGRGEGVAEQAESPDSGKRRWISRLPSYLVRAACLSLLVFVTQQLLVEGRQEAGEVLAGPESLRPLIDSDSGRRVPLATDFDGVLREVYVRDGDKVRRGDLLARVDNVEILQQLAELRNELQECQDRRDELYARHRAEEYRTEVERMARVTATMGRLRFEEEFVELRAPYDGVIRSRTDLVARIGEKFQAGQEVLAVELREGDGDDRPMLITSNGN